jgi:hypothetical protein
MPKTLSAPFFVFFAYVRKRESGGGWVGGGGRLSGLSKISNNETLEEMLERIIIRKMGEEEEESLRYLDVETILNCGPFEFGRVFCCLSWLLFNKPVAQQRIYLAL